MIDMWVHCGHSVKGFARRAMNDLLGAASGSFLSSVGGGIVSGLRDAARKSISVPSFEDMSEHSQALPPRPLWRVDVRDCLQALLELLRARGCSPPILLGDDAVCAFLSGAACPWTTTIRLHCERMSADCASAIEAAHAFGGDTELERDPDGFSVMAVFRKRGPASLWFQARTVRPDGRAIADHMLWQSVGCLLEWGELPPGASKAVAAGVRVGALNLCGPMILPRSAAAAAHAAGVKSAPDATTESLINRMISRAPHHWRWISAHRIWEPCVPISSPSIRLFIPGAIVVFILVLLAMLAFIEDDARKKRPRSPASGGARPSPHGHPVQLAD